MYRVADEVCSTSGRTAKFHANSDQHCQGWRSHIPDSRSFRTNSRQWRQWARQVSRLVTRAEPQGKKYPELEKIVEEKDSRGSDKPIKIVFRAVNTFDLWIWFEFYKPPTKDDKDLLETVLESWFVLGRLGGFNGMNLQVSQNASGQASFYKYEADDTESANQAVFMNYSEVESQGKWCRFWLNMGTADEVALDVLLNAMAVFSKENVGIKQLIVGGANPDWPVVSREEQALEDLKNPYMADGAAQRVN